MSSKSGSAGSETFLTQALPTAQVDEEIKRRAVRSVLWQYENQGLTRESVLTALEAAGLLETAQEMYAEARTREAPPG